MSEYQDYFFSDPQREQECSFLKSPFMDDNRMSDIDFLHPNQFYKELTQTYDVAGVTEIEQKQKIPEQKSTLNNLKRQKRIKRKIYFDQQKNTLRKQIFRGLKNDTTQLNTNFKTILLKKFKELSALRQLESSDKQIIIQFNKAVPSFLELKRIKKSQKITKKSLTFTKSTRILFQMFNGKISFEIKMTMLKYLQALKQNFQTQNIIKWKDIKFQ